MKGTVDMSKANEMGGFLVPVGKHRFEIVEVREKETKNGDPMASIMLECISNPEYAGWCVWDNIVIPLPQSPSIKILGRTKHFLHCIDEPYEGEAVEYDTDNWIGKEVFALIIHEEPNEYHRGKQAIVAEYILDEELTKNKNEELPF